MRTPYRRLAAISRLVVITLAALVIATPASAQFGGLKKRVKKAAGQEDTSRAGAAAQAPAEGAAPGGQGGMIVLTDDVVNQLLNGLKAGRAERDAAAKEDTPYGRYQKGEAAYAVAQRKCEAGGQAFIQRMLEDQKVADKYNALMEKMVAAQGKGDMKLMAVYQDSMSAMHDPSCLVKRPEQPKAYYEAERDIEIRAEKQELKTSGFSPGDLAIVKERTIAILQGATAPGGASPLEKSAVSAKAAELKPLLGIVEQPAAQAKKPEPAPAPTPAPAPAPQVSPAASNMGDCMAKNVQSHQAEIEALGKRAQAAQAANDTPKLMAIADTMQRIQMAGCQQGQ